MNSEQADQPVVSKSNSIIPKFRLSRKQIAIIVAFIAVIGAIFVYRSFAATGVVATLRGYNMMYQIGNSTKTSKVADKTASDGYALAMKWAGTASQTITIPEVSRIDIRAKGDICNGGPEMVLKIDGRQVAKWTLTATSWQNYSYTGKVNAGAHNVQIGFTKDYYIANRCDRNLYLDTIQFYGTETLPVPSAQAPTLTVSEQTINWNALPGITNYRLATTVGTDRSKTTYSVVTGTSITPPSVPGQTVYYGLRADVSGAQWSQEVSITYPGNTTPNSPTNPTPGQNASCTKNIPAGANLQSAINAARAGDVLCLPAKSVYNENITVRPPTVGTANARIVITSADRSQPATIKGRLWVAPGANYITFKSLYLNGNLNGNKLPSPTVGADYTSFLNNDVSNDNTAICFNTTEGQYGTAHYTVIDSNRIHHCGILPAQNHDHGVYDVAYYTQITNNLIYRNADRGVQLRGAQGAVVKYNIIDSNGQGVIFGDLNASNNEVSNNIITNALLRWNIESYWGSGPVGTGNKASNNCLWSTQGGYYGSNQTVQAGINGVSVSGVTFANPQFANPAAGDYRIPANSPCMAIIGSDIASKVTF